jgi:hypothetical protein
MTIDLRRALPLAALALLAHEAAGQSLASRVAAVRQGVVELRFAGRPGLCGDGRHYLSFGGNTRMGEYIYEARRNAPCLPGPVRVRLLVDDGAIQNIRAYAGPYSAPSRDEQVTDLGVVPARAAAEYFLQVASRGDTRASSKAILPAVLADSTSVWRPLLAISRDQARPRSTRIDAAFWLSRFASAKLAGDAEDLASTEDVEGREDDPRTSAVFALSQLRLGEGIVPLVQVARTNRDIRVRRQALFWLSQTGDARGLDVMEEILSR